MRVDPRRWDADGKRRQFLGANAVGFAAVGLAADPAAFGESSTRIGRPFVRRYYEIECVPLLLGVGGDGIQRNLKSICFR